MSSANEAAGIVFLCDGKGTILQVFCDEIGISEKIFPGGTLGQAVERHSFNKTLNFIATLSTQGTAFG